MKPSAVLRDFQLPPDLAPPPTSVVTRAGVTYRSAAWTPEALTAVAAALGHGAAVLRTLTDEDLLAAWSAAVEAFLNPAAAERRSLESPLAALCGLSPEGLDAGLEAVLGGVRRTSAGAVLAQAATQRAILAQTATRRVVPAPAATRRAVLAVRTQEGLPAAGAADAGPERPAAEHAAPGTPAPDAPVVVVLSSNLPALAVQPLLPILALRRPVLLKSPSAEPLFAPAFVAALARREPRLAGAVAAATWPGGDQALEAPLLAAAGRVVAYGDQTAVADLARRAPGRVVAYGPKTSIAAVDPDSDAEAQSVAAAVARDVALFDQRGCLSVAAVYLAGDLAAARQFARHLEAALGGLATRWPPGPAAPAALAAVQQLRLEAELRGLPASALPPAVGTVLVEADPAFRPTPGLRTVRIHPLPGLDGLCRILAPWRGRLQGAALAGAAAWRLAPCLASLGISRCTSPGELQTPDAAWHNGGVDLLQVLSGDRAP